MTSKWQQLLDAPKGCLEYNPQQAFALHVFWIVRSPTAAREMLQKGFVPCSKATLRDTPTTLAYLFRIARDQSAAMEYKTRIQKIGQHPHYLPAFKNMDMGIPQASIEMRLIQGGINPAPLKWGPEEPIAGHEAELDFDPVVLECTEIYLDNRSFYEHAASKEWMTYSAEILKPARSLKPTTYCVGNPNVEIWEKSLEPSLKAIWYKGDDVRQEVQELLPGVFLLNEDWGTSKECHVLFMEMDLKIHRDKLVSVRSYISGVQQDLAAPYMIVMPVQISEDDSKQQEHFHVRLMLTTDSPARSTNLSHVLKESVDVGGRILVFDESSVSIGNEFVAEHGMGMSVCLECVGYALHPLFQQLVANHSINYTLQ